MFGAFLFNPRPSAIYFFEARKYKMCSYFYRLLDSVGVLFFVRVSEMLFIFIVLSLIPSVGHGGCRYSHFPPEEDGKDGNPKYDFIDD